MDINIPALLAIMVVFFILVAWMYFGENVKVPETFTVTMKDGDILSAYITDPSGRDLYTVNGYAEGETDDTKSVKVPNCQHFCIHYDRKKIVGIGPFGDIDGNNINQVLGRVTEDFEMYHNTHQIRRSVIGGHYHED